MSEKYWITLMQLARLVNWEHKETRKALYKEIVKNQKLKRRLSEAEKQAGEKE